MNVNPEKFQYPPQRILLENQHSRLVHTTRVSRKLTKAEEYAKRRGGSVLAKTGKINGYDVFLGPAVVPQKMAHINGNIH